MGAKFLISCTVLVAFLLQYGNATECSFCNFINMRYSGLPKIDGMDFDSMLPTSVPGMNDTACHDGTNTATMPCDSLCSTADLEVTLAASVPIGDGNSISYGLTMVMVMRMCAAPGTAPGCTPITTDTRLGPPQGPNNEQQSIQDLISQMVQNTNQSVTPTISGQLCVCDGGDRCNETPSTKSLTGESTTTTTDATATDGATAEPGATTTKKTTNGGTTIYQSIGTLIAIVFVSALLAVI